MCLLFQFHIPVAVTLASTVSVSKANPTVQVTTFSAIFPVISTISYTVTFCWNCLDETILMNGHNIGLGGEIRKLLFEKTLALYLLPFVTL